MAARKANNRTNKDNGNRAAGKMARAKPERTQSPGETPRRKNSRQKGAAGERELAHEFQAAGYPNARRGQQRSGLDQADVIGGPAGWHVESKRVERLDVYGAHDQARRDCPAGSTPIVAWRRNGRPWLAVLALDDWLALVRRANTAAPNAAEHEAAALAAFLADL